MSHPNPTPLPHRPIATCRRSLLGLPMLHPYSRVSVAWRAAMLVFDLTFTAFWVPLNIGFCYSNYGNLAAPCTQSDLAGGGWRAG